MRNPQHALERTRASESVLLHILDEITARLREKGLTEDQKRLKAEDAREQRELRFYMLSGLISRLTQLSAEDIADPPPDVSARMREESANERKEREDAIDGWLRARYAGEGTGEWQDMFDPDRDFTQ